MPSPKPKKADKPKVAVACKWCGSALKVGALSDEQKEKGAMCPQCAKQYGGAYYIAERA